MYNDSRFNSYWRILGISPTNDLAELKSAWKSAIRKKHPDVCKDSDATAQSQLINEAFSALEVELKNPSRSYESWEGANANRGGGYEAGGQGKKGTAWGEQHFSYEDEGGNTAGGSWTGSGGDSWNYDNYTRAQQAQSGRAQPPPEPEQETEVRGGQGKSKWANRDGQTLDEAFGRLFGRRR